MHYAKKWWKPLSNIIKDSSTIMRNPLPEYVGRGCASILDTIAKGISLFPRFFAWCIPSLHPYSMIFALVPHIFDGSRINAATRMRTCIG